MKNKFKEIERSFEMTKALEDDGTFEGYASVWDVEDTYGDVIRKGAFKVGLEKLAKEKRVLKMLWNHDRHIVMGTFPVAKEDSKGLFVQGKLTLGVQKADETRLLMLDKAIDSMSIGAYVIKYTTDNKTMKTEYTELELREISPCTFPALDAARIISVKSLSDVGDLSELETYLRDVGGFSQTEAKTIISKSKSVNLQRDVVGAVDLIKTAINNLKG